MRKFARLMPLYLNVLLPAVTAVASMPVMISATGLMGWTSVAVAQTVGSVAAPVLGLGWAITGPAQVARATGSIRWSILRESMTLRGWALLPATLLGVLVAWMLVSGAEPLLIFAGFASTAYVALDASFYYLGTGQLWRLLLFSGLPRALGTVCGVLMLLLIPGASIGLVPALTATGAIAGTVGSLVDVRRQSRRGGRETLRRPVSQVLREQWAPTTSSLAGSVFLLVPTSLVSFISPGSLADFVFLDRLTKQASTFISPAMNYLQGWVPRGADTASTRARLRSALVASVALGIVAIVGFGLLGGVITEWLSSGSSHASVTISIAMGLIVALTIGDYFTSRIMLVHSRQMRALALTTLIGSAAGALVAALLCGPLGALGALLGIAAGLLVRSIAAIAAYRPPGPGSGSMVEK